MWILWESHAKRHSILSAHRATPQSIGPVTVECPAGAKEEAAELSYNPSLHLISTQMPLSIVYKSLWIGFELIWIWWSNEEETCYNERETQNLTAECGGTKYSKARWYCPKTSRLSLICHPVLATNVCPVMVKDKIVIVVIKCNCCEQIDVSCSLQCDYRALCGITALPELFFRGFCGAVTKLYDSPCLRASWKSNLGFAGLTENDIQGTRSSESVKET